MEVEFHDNQNYYRYGHGWIASRDQYHSVEHLPPPDVRQFGGKRVPLVTTTLAPIINRVVVASQRGIIDSIRHIESMASSITSNSLFQYIQTKP